MTPEELKELQELEELEALERQYGKTAAPMAQPNPQESTRDYAIRQATGQYTPEEAAQNEEIMGAAMGGSSEMGKATASALGTLMKPMGKVADYVMQRAMGMKQYLPGAGTQALEEGVVGTKGMMAKQIQKPISKYNDQLQQAVSNIKQPTIESAPIAQSLFKEATGFESASGITPSSAKPFLNKALNRAAEVEARGALPPKEQLEIKRIVQKRGYKDGKPLNRYAAQLDQKEALEIGEALEKASAAEGRPGAVSVPNKALHKLLSADRGLSAPDKLQGPITRVYESLAPAIGSVAAKTVNPTGAMTVPTARTLESLLRRRKEENE